MLVDRLKCLWLTAGLLVACVAGCSRQEGVSDAPVSGATPVVVEPVIGDVDHPISQLRPGYAGAESCQECHQHEHETWHASYHRTMTTMVGPETVKGNFSNVVARAYGATCRMSMEGGEYWMDIASGNDRLRAKMVMITGSHHMQVYWFPAGKMRVLGMAPVVYLHETGQWIPRDAAFLKPPLRSRSLEIFRWSQTCIKCHTTGGVPGFYFDAPPDQRVAGQAPDRMDTHASEFGISCEACHGPAAEHVALRRQYGDKKIEDDPIALPTDFDPSLSSQACGQCHSIRFMQSQDVSEQYVTNGFASCVGLSIEDTGQFVLDRKKEPVHPFVAQELARNPAFFDTYFWKDGMVRVSGREYNGLIQSPCFTHGEASRQMSCFDCHQMHQGKNDMRSREDWANDQLKPGQREGAACIKCHQGYDGAEHTHHAVSSPGSNCLNCHMPHTTYGLLKGIRNHTISSPSVRETTELGRPNACNLCHLDKSLGWTADYLASWYGQEPPQLNDKEKAVPASLMWIYAGDAGLRALRAWSMGWESARAASDADWLATPLIDRLSDTYDAVRYIAYRSLSRDATFRSKGYEFMGLPGERTAAIDAIRKANPYPDAWRSRLDIQRGEVSENILEVLSLSRDDKPVFLAE